eukprot:jgi/Tetstr1/445401/TSEL_033185.t1
MRHLCRRLKHQGGSRHRAPDFIENAVRAVGLRKDCKVPPVRHKSLSETGQRTKLIVMVGLGGGDICDKKTHDWRARFPRYLGRMVNASVVVWRLRFNTCFICSVQGGEQRDCAELMHGGVDTLVVLGSGRYHESAACQESSLGTASASPEMPSSPSNLPADASSLVIPAQPALLDNCAQQYRDLWHMFQLDWAKNARFKVHFPIRRMPEVMENMLFDFDRIIDDSSFNKPPSQCTTEILLRCRHVPKAKDLSYVGRLTPGKGQLNFLQKVDAQLMRGYTLHMYGGINSTMHPEYKSQLRAVAREKQLQIKIHGEVSKGKLYAGICSSMGLVHFAKDKNPRAVYEAVQGGLPAFISQEAQVSPDLEAAPFIQVAESNSTAQFNRAFATYIRSLERPWWSTMMKWAQAHLQEEPVYTTLCERMCLCQGPATPASCPQL